MKANHMHATDCQCAHLLRLEYLGMRQLLTLATSCLHSVTSMDIVALAPSK